MINDIIDIDKSKNKGRLVTKTWLIETILNFVFYFAFLVSFPFASVLFLFAQFKNGGNLFYVIILLILTLLFSGLLLYSVINLNRLKRIKGTSKEQNIEIIREIVEQLGWRIPQHDQQLTIANPPGRWFSSNQGRQVVILYDKQDILINSTTYGMHDFKSPIHWFGNRKIENLIIEKFEMLIKTTNR